MQQVTPEATQEAIRNLGDKFRYFHLSVCACGAPGWQQPCPVCSYYPRGDGLRSCRRSVLNPSETRIIFDRYIVPEDKLVTREEYDAIVTQAGGILEWYLRSFMRCVDPQRHLLDAAREQARQQSLVFPTGAELYDWCHEERRQRQDG